LAQEGIEIARNIRDSNLLEGDSWDEQLNTPECNAGCELDYTNASQQDPLLSAYSARFLRADASGFHQYSSGNQTKYQRKITILKAGDVITITAEVFWQDKGSAYNFPVQEKLYNWY